MFLDVYGLLQLFKHIGQNLIVGLWNLHFLAIRRVPKDISYMIYIIIIFLYFGMLSSMNPCFLSNKTHYHPPLLKHNFPYLMTYILQLNLLVLLTCLLILIWLYLRMIELVLTSLFLYIYLVPGWMMRPFVIGPLNIHFSIYVPYSPAPTETSGTVSTSPVMKTFHNIATYYPVVQTLICLNICNLYLLVLPHSSWFWYFFTQYWTCSFNTFNNSLSSS